MVRKNTFHFDRKFNVALVRNSKLSAEDMELWKRLVSKDVVMGSEEYWKYWKIRKALYVVELDMKG